MEAKTKKKLVVLTGAGISVESGIPAFRSSTDALWENHRVEDVAHIDAWRDKGKRELVLRFYNERRAKARSVEPNEGHRELVRMEDEFEVMIITQNVDDLHERAGSSRVLHLHGSLFEGQSSQDPKLTFPLEKDTIELGDKCPRGSQVRPNIVWFGEDVPNMRPAIQEIMLAEAVMVIGTSLQVYPAASLLEYVDRDVPILMVNPEIMTSYMFITHRVHSIAEPASTGVATARDILRQL